MPGVAHILTYKNAPAPVAAKSSAPATATGTTPRGNRLIPPALSRELNLQGEVVAIVAAETEDLADDAIAAIKVEYEVLPFVSTLKDVMAPGAPDLRGGKGNLIRTWTSEGGDVDRGFAEADIVKEFEYHFAGAVSVPMQPSGSVAKWDGDQLTIWGMGQGIYPVRDALADTMGMDPAKIRFINKWNGSTFGAGRLAAERFYPLIAHLAKVTGRPVRVMLPKDQELALLLIKPETLTRFKVGATRDGRIVALRHEIHLSVGDVETGYHASGPGNATNQLELYTSRVPHWRSDWSVYKTNAPRPGPSRSYVQQETKWSWEAMMDEMAETLGLDPLEFRLKHITRPAAGDDRYPYDSFPSVEVLTEGAKAFEWSRRSPTPAATPGRFKRGVGLGMSQHHGGLMGYHEGEEAFAALAAAPDASIFGAELEVGASGDVTMKVALPDSGSNAGTALAAVVAEMLGFTSRTPIRVLWGDTNLAPSSDEWFGGRTITLQGAAICSAADKLRKDLIDRASRALKADAATLQMKDGRIFPADNPRQGTTFAALARANGGVHPDAGPRRGGRRADRRQQGRRRLLRRSRGGHVDRRLALRARHLRARHRDRDQSAGGRGRHDRLARREHADRHRSDSVGSRVPRHQALQRRLPVVPAADDHGCAEADAGVHRQPRAALVLRHQELQRDQHRRRAGRAGERDLQRLRRPHPRASDHARQDHGRLEGAGAASMKKIA